MENSTAKKPVDKWDKRFIDLAFTIATWSSCYKSDRQIGAVIVIDNGGKFDVLITLRIEQQLWLIFG